MQAGTPALRAPELGIHAFREKTYWERRFQCEDHYEWYADCERILELIAKCALPSIKMDQMI